MSERNIQISMSTSTVEALTRSGYQLYGFKAVATTMGGGAPLVWFNSNRFSTSTIVSWQSRYEAYTSHSEIRSGARIAPAFTAPIRLGQTLKVTSPAGTGSVESDGVAAAISILNATTQPFTCGIAEQQGGNQPTPFCAFPLYGNGMDIIAPLEKVLLVFAANQINPGTVVERAYAPGYLIDLADASERQVTFDINLGWSNDGGVWARQVRANESLLPLLIDSSPTAVRALVKAA